LTRSVCSPSASGSGVRFTSPLTSSKKTSSPPSMLAHRSMVSRWCSVTDVPVKPTVK
jgi:hypothetical protein